MQNENVTGKYSVQQNMEEIWKLSCGHWENCDLYNIKSFLSQCQEHNIDPQFCMNWIDEHKSQIPNSHDVLETAREWVIRHTSTGTPISMSELDIH